MSETSTSLLERLRSDPHSKSWQRLNDLYTPLIRNWLRKHAVFDKDSDDLVQDVMLVVIRRLPEFEHNGRVGAFRSWLRTITVNCLRDFWRARRVRPVATGNSDFQVVLTQLEDPDSRLSRQWDQEHDAYVTRRLLEGLQPEFAENTWRAFKGFVLNERPAEAVAEELGISVNAVYIAKSRVLARLRQEAAGLVDEW